MQKLHKLRLPIISLLLFTLSAVAQPQPSSGYPIAGSHLLKKHEQALQNYVRSHPHAFEQNTALSKTISGGFTVGSKKSWYATNFVSDTEYLVSATCRAIGTNCYIFAEDSNWTSGRITQAAVDSIEHAFDLRTPANPSEGIFQMDTSAFGNPPDVDHDPRIIIFILDIRDGFTPGGGYIAGYFYNINEYSDLEVRTVLGPQHHSNFAEIYYVDCNPANLTTLSGFTNACSTTAHEFQHMIHFNYTDFINAKDTVSHSSFINEGCSVLAEVNCGYSIYEPNLYVNETNHYLFDWRDNDMTNVQKDYSRAARYFTYIRDQIGIGVFKKIVASIYDDIACIDDALTKYGSSHRFSDLLPDWFIANILNDTAANPLYGYRYAGLPDVSATVFNTPNDTGSNISIERYASQYYSISGGYRLTANFTTSSNSLFVQAVETGSSGSRVVPVPTNTSFSEPLYGTTYPKIDFIVYDTSGSHTAAFSFVTSGESTPTGIASSSSLPNQYGLYQNYPNPFNPSTTIRYQLPSGSKVSITVYDLLGHEITTLVNQQMPAGTHTVSFDGSRVASGVYFYRIVADHFTATKKFVLLK